jgi:salicylate hydroxylase
VDGSSATADAMVGCDGIMSRVRQFILGEDNPKSYPQYSCVYAYRGLLPMDKAFKALGKETAVSRVVHVRKPL